MNHPVIRNRNRAMSPADRLADDILYIRDTVEITHFRMAVKLHTLFGSCIHSIGMKIRAFDNSPDTTDHHFPVILRIKRRHSVDLDIGSRSKLCDERIRQLIRNEQLDGNGIRLIRYGKLNNPLICLCRTIIHGKDFSLEGVHMVFLDNLGNRNGILLEIITVDHAWMIRSLQRKRTSARTGRTLFTMKMAAFLSG